MTDTSPKRPIDDETLIAQGLHYADAATGAVMPPIHMATTYARDADYALINAEHSYSRAQNPTYLLAENMLATLERAERALLFASGMAAATAVFRSLKPGDHVVAPSVMYWGLRNWLVDFCPRWGIGLTLFDVTDPDALAGAVRKGETQLVWIETPTNPLWDITDIAEAAEIAHAAGAQLAVDSTVATPVHTRPLELGADIVMHSATKSLNGHSDVLAGALACKRKDAFWQRIEHEREEGGAVAGAFEAWLLQRGMRTLFVRVRQASSNALAVARHFEHHPAIESVRYPGLASHPGHAVAARQMQDGFGAMLSLGVHGGPETALAVAGHCRLFARATSLGGVESLIEHRASIEGKDSPIPANLLRLSIGIEKAGDLIEDLEQALRAAEASQ